MSLGQTTSAPASTCETAVRASSSSVASLSTSSSRSTPQWPCDVYSHRQTSVSSSSSGKRGAQLAQRALHDAVVVPRARALVVLLLGDAEEDHRLHAERARAPRPRARRRRREKRPTCRQQLVPLPSRARRRAACTKWSRSSRVSRTSVAKRRRCGAARRSRVTGNAAHARQSATATRAGDRARAPTPSAQARAQRGRPARRPRARASPTASAS